ncbi:hypothetical protein ACIQZI_13185 [Peribacillus sp. NPDC096379]|uniref:hypothetical protein n=1 Tax=Peribacillus sp. NPDC096379 TaxID=3364393 RepID=UPI0037FA250A
MVITNKRQMLNEMEKAINEVTVKQLVNQIAKESLTGRIDDFNFEMIKERTSVIKKF